MACTSYVRKEHFPITHERYWVVYQRWIDVAAPEQFGETIPPLSWNVSGTVLSRTRATIELSLFA